MDYRAGIKSFWLGNRLRVNAGIFNIKWDDQQLSGSSTTQWANGQSGAMSCVDNIGKSRIRGLEVESEFLISSEWLMNFAYTHLDAKVVNYESAGFVNYVGKIKANGKDLPQVPANSGSLGLACRGCSGCAWTTAAEEKSCLTE